MRNSTVIKEGIPMNAYEFDIEISTNFKCAGTLEYKEQKDIIEKYFKNNIDPFLSKKFIRKIDGKEAPFFCMFRHTTKDTGVVFHVFVYASEEKIVEAVRDLKDPKNHKDIIDASYKLHKTSGSKEEDEEEISEELKALED